MFKTSKKKWYDPAPQNKNSKQKTQLFLFHYEWIFGISWGTI
jgi:hypothetical protein